MEYIMYHLYLPNSILSKYYQLSEKLQSSFDIFG